MPLAAARIVAADVLGYLSITCWLCAQFPQVLKNLQLQSCEGLALPFLCNWLFGDVTNLIGCVLTDQLPFQTYLAAYFCLVDFALVVQYFYYRRPPTPPSAGIRSPVAHAHSSPHLAYAASTAPPLPRTRSTTHPPPLSGARAGGSRRRGGPLASPALAYGGDALGSPAALDPHNEYDALYAAALGVARAAERVHRRSHSGRRRAAAAATAGADEPDALPDGMLRSFHSEMSVATTSTDRTEQADDALAASTASLYDARGRGRERGRGVYADGAARDTVDGLPGEGGRGVEVGAGARRSTSRSQSLARARGSGRRAAGVAFMSFGVLAGIGRIAGGHGGGGGARAAVGQVNLAGATAASAVAAGGTVLSPVAAQPWPSRHPLPLASFGRDPHGATIAYVAAPHDPHDPPEPFPPPREPPPAESMERIVGRVSAWCCTTLYLTSRLPQIWKNRRSVEGLSILLFVFAFCGNLTYVLSILLNPAGSADPAEAGHYLLEALPYLLGSGGTLIFDLTIMVQSVLYGSAPPVPASPLAYDRYDRHDRHDRYDRSAGARRRPARLRVRSGDLAADPERRPLLDPERETSMRGGARSGSRQRVKSAPALGQAAPAVARRASDSPVGARAAVPTGGAA